MPKQAGVTSFVRIPDGCKVEISTNLSAWTDIGLTNGDVTAVLNFDRIERKASNYGVLNILYKNMTIAGTIPLVSFNPTNLATISGGMLTATTTTAAAVSPANQVISSGDAADLTPYNLAPDDGAGTAVICSAAPTITSVTGSSDGALAANDDYNIIVDANSFSGYSIIFDVTGGATLTTMSQDFTIVYTGSGTTPVASKGVTVGSTNVIVSGLGLRFTVTDSSSYTRTLTLYSSTVNSGGFQFNFKGMESGDEFEQVDIAFTAVLDTTRTDGDQLMAYVDTNPS